MSTIKVEIPQEMVEFCYDRIRVFIKKHYDHQAARSKTLVSGKFSEEYGFKEAMMSSYLQGLSDANTALINENNPH